MVISARFRIQRSATIGRCREGIGNQKRFLRSDLNRAHSNSTKTAVTFGNHISACFNSIRNLVKKFVAANKTWTLPIPMSLL